MTWKASPDLVAQLSHFAWGGFLYLCFAAHQHTVIGVLVVLAFAGAKEFLFDVRVEKQPFKNNLIDFVVYVAGLGVAVAIAH